MDVEDRRKHYRLRIRMKIRLEGVDMHSKPFVEETETVNVSMQGASFLTQHKLTVGQLVSLTVPDKCKVQARLVWVGETQEGGRREAGVHILPPLDQWVIRPPW